MKKKKEAKMSKKKKLLLLIFSLLVMLGFSVYGISRYVFAYEIVDWDGDFGYSQNAWKYNTEGRRYCDFTWAGNTVQVRPGTAGYTAVSSGGVYSCEVDEYQAAAYLVPIWKSKGIGIQVGDTVTWQADSGVKFTFNNGSYTKSVTASTVAEAETLNNTNYSQVKTGISSLYSNADFSGWDSDYGPFWFAINDNTGLKVFCHKFSTQWEVFEKSSAFTIQPVKLNIDIDPKGANAGSVTGAGGYLPGTTVTVSATANSGYTFEGWYINGVKKSSSASWPTTLPDVYGNNVSQTITAKFTEDIPKEYTVSASANPSAGGSVEGDLGSFLAGSTINVEAVPADGYRFSGWTSTWSGFSSGSASASFTMPSVNVSLVANFVKTEADKYYITFVDKYYVGSTYSFSFNGVSGYYCTSVSVSPASSGLSVSL